MGTALYLILLSISCLSIFIITKTIYYREKINQMTGMMIAMTLGMSVGLAVGLIFGILFSGNFFIAAVLGMLVGLLIGSVVGLTMNLMVVLDGLQSGLMGGMMGAMLGEMIAPESYDPMVKIMFFIYLGTILILNRTINDELNHQSKMFNNLFIIVAVFMFFFIIFELINPTFH